MSGPTRKKIGTYEVMDPLDQGGMGIVYLAEQPELERIVVLKTLRRDLVLNREVDERFRREAGAAARVHHQNVVAVYDCFSWRGERFIAQEYVDGEDLSAVLRVVRRLDPRIAALVALELARGLEEIHAQGIVHRDLKPSNILLGREGETKIADFGIALEATGQRLTQTGHAVGTPPYMSPEQLLGERPDSRSDVFAFGVLLYEMLTGKPPFEESDPERDEALIRRIQAGRYTPPRKLAAGVPRALSRLVRDCLRPKPAKRPACAAELRERLERHLRSPSPIACRGAISTWLWEHKVFVPPDNATVLAVAPPKRRRGAWLPMLRSAAAVAGAAALIASAVVVERGGLPAWPGLPELPALRGGEVATARVSFDVKPWARVEIDDRPPFRTPLEKPIELAPGSHRLALEHPEYGRVERTLELEAGERRVVEHVFSKR